MANVTRPGGVLERQRAIQLPVLDSVLWLIRIAAIVLVVYGAFLSITSGRLNADQWRRLIVIALAQGSVYSLIALGYTMVYGVLRFINFAHGEVFMIGGMTGFFVSSALAGTTLWENYIWVALFITLLCCAAASTAVALILERVAYRPLRGAPRLVPFITAIGASFFLQYTIAGLFGTSVNAYPAVPALDGSVIILGFVFQKTQLLAIVAAILMMVGLYVFVERTKTGKAMRAVAEDQETAQLMGINVDRTIALTFVLGGALAGAAGVVQILFNQATVYTLGFRFGLNSFTSAVLGGIGNLSGAVLGGIVLGLINAFSDRYISAQWTNAIVFGVLIGILVFRPTGLLGQQLADRA
jgi:branched-chain amino acid transport system permease protein